MILIACHQPAKVLQPGKQALDLPAAFVPAQGATVLGRRSLSVSAVRRDQLDAPGGQSLVQRVAVVGRIPDQPLGLVLEEAALEGGLNKGDLMRRSRRCVDGDRNTSAVCPSAMSFVPLPRLVFPTAAPPFWPPRSCRRGSTPRGRSGPIVAGVPPRPLTPASGSPVAHPHGWKRRWQGSGTAGSARADPPSGRRSARSTESRSHHRAVLAPRAAFAVGATFRFGKQGLDDCPLVIRQLFASRHTLQSVVLRREGSYTWRVFLR